MSTKIKQSFLRTEKEAYSLISESQFQFYVYILINPITREPFYVGKGQGNRCFSHYNNKSIEDNPKSSYLRKLKRKPLYFFYVFCDDEDFAYSRESYLIYKLGIKTKKDRQGLLYNIVEGQGDSYFKYKTPEIIKRLEESENGKSGKYDYSNVLYKGSDYPINVLCKEHGVFQTTVIRHTNREQGCPKCAGQNLETEDIVRKSIDKHGDKYDYSLVKYTGIKNNINVICKEHGIFSILPGKHYLGWGCPKCSGRGNSITTNDMIKRFEEKHGNKYDYSKVVYVNSKEEVTVTCKIHGDFKTLCKPHYLGGTGCPKCSVRNRTTEQVIVTLKQVMGENYSFDKTVYVGAKEPMIITCKKHGDFELSYNRITSSGRGCPQCGMERLSLPRVN